MKNSGFLAAHALITVKVFFFWAPNLGRPWDGLFFKLAVQILTYSQLVIFITDRASQNRALEPLEVCSYACSNLNFFLNFPEWLKRVKHTFYS
jgi:hypothetical protein